MGGSVFTIFAGIYYWFPKMTGRMLNETLGKTSFWLMFIGFNVTFFVQHSLGLSGMPRRIYTYQPGLGWSTYNLISTIGSFILGSGIVATVVNVARNYKYGRSPGPIRGRATRSSGSRPRHRRSTISTRSRVCGQSSRCATSGAR